MQIDNKWGIIKNLKQSNEKKSLTLKLIQEFY